MRLDSLYFDGNPNSTYGKPMKSLSPLKGMPLRTLQIGSLEDGDLSPLEGMPLVDLFIFNAEIKNISVLKGMPLQFLTIRNCQIAPDTDFSMLQDMPLRGNCGLDFKTCIGTPSSSARSRPWRRSMANRSPSSGKKSKSSSKATSRESAVQLIGCFLSNSPFARGQMMALSPLLDFLKAATGFIRPEASVADEVGESAVVAARYHRRIVVVAGVCGLIGATVPESLEPSCRRPTRGKRR